MTRPLRDQRGVAVITALLLTTLAVTIVASLFWQQQVQVRAIENQRLQLQKQWVLRGAMDWARLILREDGKYSSTDDLNEPWSVPLANTRLDQYVEKDDVKGDAGSAMLSGAIQDAQSRLNLTGLASAGTVNAGEVSAFERPLVLSTSKTCLRYQALRPLCCQCCGRTSFFCRAPRRSMPTRRLRRCSPQNLRRYP